MKRIQLKKIDTCFLNDSFYVYYETKQKTNWSAPQMRKP